MGQSFKARLVVKEIDKNKDIGFNKIFILVMKLTFIIIILGIVVVRDLHLERFDV